MTDPELADEIIKRLNALLQDPVTRVAINDLVETRVVVSTKLDDHPSIQVVEGKLGFLGLLNGIVGAIPEGERKGWGLIVAYFDDDENLMDFRRTQ